MFLHGRPGAQDVPSTAQASSQLPVSHVQAYASPNRLAHLPRSAQRRTQLQDTGGMILDKAHSMLNYQSNPQPGVGTYTQFTPQRPRGQKLAAAPEMQSI